MQHDQYESDLGDAQFDEEAENDIEPGSEANKKPKKNKLTASGGLRRKPAKKAAKRAAKKARKK